KAANQQAVSTLQQIAPGFLNFRADIASFQNITTDYQRRLTQASADLISILQRIATAHEEHLNVEQNLSQQIGTLNNIQQAAVTRTETIAASMSATAQSVVHIAD